MMLPVSAMTRPLWTMTGDCIYTTVPHRTVKKLKKVSGKEEVGEGEEGGLNEREVVPPSDPSNRPLVSLSFQSEGKR